VRAALIGAGAAVAGVGMANLNLGSLGLKRVEAASSTAGWSLRVKNQAGSTTSYTLAQLSAMPATTLSAVLLCDECQVAAGEWRGVSLGYLLQEAGLGPEATSIDLRATDGYEISLQLPQALDPGVIVAYENNGAPLAEVLRLVVPWDEGFDWVGMIDAIDIIAIPADSSQNANSGPPGQGRPRFENARSPNRDCGIAR